MFKFWRFTPVALVLALAVGSSAISYAQESAPKVQLPADTQALIRFNFRAIIDSPLAKKMGIEKIVLKKSILITYFVNNPDSSFYSSAKFKEVIGNIQAHPGIFRMREDQEKLSLRSEQVNSVHEAYQILQKLSNG